MTPHVYMRLQCRRSNVVHQHVDYDLTYDGIEDPKSTIIPICRRVSKSQNGGQSTRFYLYYRDAWIEATIVQDSSELVVLRVPIGAKPVHHELPTP